MAEEEKKAGEFRSALMGFKKSDVLAYIDALTAENLKKEADHLARLQELQGKVGLLEEDKNTLLAKTREICEQLTDQQKRADAAEVEMQQLRDSLQSSSEKLENCKMRMFSQEQELMNLRAENCTLKESLTDKMNQAEQLQKTCEELRRQLEAKEAQLREAEERRIQQGWQGSSGAEGAKPEIPPELATGVEILKQQIHDATDSLHTVLDEARTDLKKLSDKLDQKGARRWCSGLKGAAGAQKNAPRRSLADTLLERMSHLMEEIERRK